MKNNNLNNIKSTGFKTPDDYFESFEDKLFEKINKEALIKGVETSGYVVPKNYFDSIDDTILNKVTLDEKPVVKLNPRKTFYYIAGIAASLILMISIYINVEKQENSISAEMVETYLEDRDLNSYELAQLLLDADILEDDFTIATTPYEEENLESYLLDNSDIETILEY
ncbi:hypothetical protein [Winogradskyella sp. PG-2]|uniref:hypothetical protein n=1 Tax=Winogradskyella sp. PG-2 TaxID=754409 RepID=UPI00045881D0|nr:hypothetical protein [Winogradskyella sp. PG-2]BAO76810.1 hypothetical protein WPG_2580 [Winogradskyella sp. PG-2]